MNDEYRERIDRYATIRAKRPKLSHEEAWARSMTTYSHLEPGRHGPTLYESIFVAMLFALWIFIMLGCAVGELTVRLFPPKRHAALLILCLFISVSSTHAHWQTWIFGDGSMVTIPLEEWGGVADADNETWTSSHERKLPERYKIYGPTYIWAYGDTKEKSVEIAQQLLMQYPITGSPR